MPALKRTHKRVLFAGAYGIENAGDDLPLIVMCEQLKRMLPAVDFDFRALSRHPNPWEEATYGVRMIKNLEYESREEATGRWFKGFNCGDDRSELQRIQEEIRQCDLLILGAGNWLIDLTIDLFRGPIPLLAVYIFLANLYHKPVMLYGISAGPFHTSWGRLLSGWIADNTDLITVRDRTSQTLLEGLLSVERTVHLLPDATLGLDPPPLEQCAQALLAEGIRRTSRKAIAIGIRDVHRIVGEATAQWLEDQIIRTIHALKDEYEFVFLPQSTYFEDDDRIYAERLCRSIRSDVVCSRVMQRRHPAVLAGMYGLFDITLAIRLHAAVFSIISTTPVIAINYLPKMAGFMESVGQSRYCLDVDQAGHATLLQAVRDIERHSMELRAELKTRGQAMRTEAQGYAQLILEKDLLKL
jgi:polysaccharide pyruvyl transferase WcaK-like protein